MRGVLSSRGKALASSGGAAAALWEAVNALAAKPGMINMGQGFPDFPGSRVARDVAGRAIAEGAAATNQSALAAVFAMNIRSSPELARGSHTLYYSSIQW